MTEHQTGHISDQTVELVDFVQDTSIEEIPGDVIERSKLTLLDMIGSLLAASNEDYQPGKKLATFAEETGGSSSSSIIGYGFKTSCVNAALVNGTMGYFCDLDPHHPEAITHTPAIMVPSSLAIGEHERVTGAAFLEALITGVEVSCRVSLALNPKALYNQGFHPTPISGSFGSAMASSKLFDVDTDQYLISLGLAQNQTSGLLSWKEEHTESFRPFNPGIAARNGVTSAYLALLDFGSPVDPFHGEYNIFRAFSDGKENIGELTRELGESYTIMEHAFKRYSSVAFSHTGLDALLSLIEENNLNPTEITNIELRFPTSGVELIEGTDLNSHSIQYLLAIATLEREVHIDDIVTDRNSEVQVADLMEKINIVRDDELDRRFPERYTSIVNITTHSNTYSKRVDHAKGTPEKPFDKFDIEEKFRTLTDPMTSEDQREEIMDIVYNIENLDDITKLGDLLR